MNSAEEIREYLIDVTERRGGHIGANLSTVELTMAIHESFDLENDWVLFDTGHQGYTHKILTGRASDLETLNRDNGVSRFLSKKESSLVHNNDYTRLPLSRDLDRMSSSNTQAPPSVSTHKHHVLSTEIIDSATSSENSHSYGPTSIDVVQNRRGNGI